MKNRAGARKKPNPCFNCNNNSGDVSVSIPCPGCRLKKYAAYMRKLEMHNELVRACWLSLNALNAANHVLGGGQGLIPQFYLKERKTLRKLIRSAKGVS